MHKDIKRVVKQAIAQDTSLNIRRTPNGYNKVYRGDVYLFSFSITPKGCNAVNNIRKDFERYAGVVLCD